MSKKPIHVLHVFGYFDRGGAETMVMNLFRSIDQSEIKFGFVVHGDKIGAFEEEVKNMGADIFRVPAYKGSNHFEYIKAWKEIFNNHPEYSIIHGHVRSTASIYLKIAKEYGLTTIAHSHNTSSGSGIIGKIKDMFQYNIRYHTDEFLGCSIEAGEWLFGDEIVKQDNFNVLNNAIDSSDFKFNEKIRAQKRKELNLEDKFLVGHVGSFTNQKNHSYLIDIFNEILKLNSNAVLLLAGEGELKTNIQNKVKELSIEDNVLFLGLRADINDLLQAMDIFLFPSLFEGLPVTLVETQAAGLPSVVSDVITQEIKITDLVNFFPLEKAPREWAEFVLNTANNYERKDTSEFIKAAEYDITVTSKWYSNFIKELAG